MKLEIGSSFLLVFVIGIGVCMAEDPIPNRMSPRLESLLASVQSRAAKQIEAQRQQAASASPVEVAAASLATGSASGQSEPLRTRNVHVHAPTVDDRVNDMLEHRQPDVAKVPQPVPQFLIRADGRPIGSGTFKSYGHAAGPQVRELRGALKIDRDREDVPQFKIYFEGMETTNNDEGFYSFPIESANIQKYAIIICNKIKHSFGRHNTVEGFGLIPDMNYKYFRYKRNADGSGKWVQREKDLRKKNLQIPSNAIVLTINPAYFDRLDESWPGNFGSGVLKLPRIVLKEDKRSKIERKSVKSLLYGLDMSPFHTNVQHASKEIGDGKGEVLVDNAT
jgi:hypothetical protein